MHPLKINNFLQNTVYVGPVRTNTKLTIQLNVIDRQI